MKILVVSDTHGYETNLRTVFSKIGRIDYLIHCGDVEEHEAAIEEMAGCPCTFVRGNNDYASKYPYDTVITLENQKIFVTHGHRYGVSWDNTEAINAAKKAGCSVLMYGHTHRPLIELALSERGVTAINPGSLTFPRQEGRKPSFIVMETDRFGKAHFTLNYLGRGNRLFFR
ncbi:MAG: metallophosphoesterase [Lachnospiraceae bacterium]|nr:metallophosphoesterase [Lachnospiraceae bacterium]